MSIEYGKVLVLNFSEKGKTVICWSKKVMKRQYLLAIFEFSMIFQDLGNMVFGAMTYVFSISEDFNDLSFRIWTAWNTLGFTKQIQEIWNGTEFK